MSEKSPWPEPNRFSPETGLKQRCAELSMLALIHAGYRTITHYGGNEITTSQTEIVDAIEDNDEGRYIESLRVMEHAGVQMSTELTAGESDDFNKHETAQHVRMFALQYGVLDKDGIDEEVTAEHYSWKSLAHVAVETDHPAGLTEETVTLLDAETGQELDMDRTLHLLGLLEAVYANLCTDNYAQGRLINSLEPAGITEAGIFSENYPAFEPGEFISGNHCDECGSSYATCSHLPHTQN